MDTDTLFYNTYSDFEHESTYLVNYCQEFIRHTGDKNIILLFGYYNFLHSLSGYLFETRKYNKIPSDCCYYKRGDIVPEFQLNREYRKEITSGFFSDHVLVFKEIWGIPTMYIRPS